MTLDEEIRSAIAGSIKFAKPKRSLEEIATAISTLLGREVTPAALKDFSKTPSHGRPYRLPAEMVPPFCAATGQFLLMEILSQRARQFAEKMGKKR